MHAQAADGRRVISQVVSQPERCAKRPASVSYVELYSSIAVWFVLECVMRDIAPLSEPTDVTGKIFPQRL